MRLKGSRVTIGLTGGIAAYKICELVRNFVKAGIETRIIMTESATKFVTKETFRVISRKEVLVDTFEYTSPDRVEHIALTDETDLFIVAPASANTIAKMAWGLADNMLTTFFLAYKGKTLICPTMNHKMFTSLQVQENINRLKNLGVHVLEPESGELACGEEGKGRLPNVNLIFEKALELLSIKDFEGKRILVTAGPTREHIDPVRFISNPSSGKMGYAIAKAAKRRGADVTLISGPTWLSPPYGVETIMITSAEEMCKEVIKRILNTEIVIMSAAVADYRPKMRFESKIKKERASINVIELERNPDIIQEINKNRPQNLYLVGFAAETEEIIKNAEEKLKRKNMDMIVANLATQAFQKDTNKITIIKRNGEIRYLPEMHKEELADEILDEIIIDLSTR